jgi:glutamate racemase
MSNLGPIGFFDSGVGGTSIWKEVIQLLPNESSIYLADSKNAPYGEKSINEIIALSKKNTDKLLDMGCKLIVVACNTATTNAISFLRNNYNVPFIGIEPAIKPAALNSKNKSVGILATKGTLSSELFHKTSELYSKNIIITEVIGHGLVKLIEEGKQDSPEMESLLQTLLSPMLTANIDYLVLGCSHYPYLIPVLKRILPTDVSIIDSGEAVAKQTGKVMDDYKLNASANNRFPNHQLYTNTDPLVLSQMISDLTVKYKVDYLDF